MFLNEPHSTHRYYGELLSSYQSKLFSEAHSPAPYYASSAGLAKMEALFTDGKLPRSLRHFKFHVLMVFRLQNEPSDLPPLNSKAIEAYCDALMNAMQGAKGEVLFRRAGDTVRAVMAKFKSREPPERTKAFTSALIDAAATRTRMPAASQRLDGIVKDFSTSRATGSSNRTMEQMFLSITRV